MTDIIILIAFVFMGCVILFLGIWHIELNNDNEALQVENSNLIERNQKLDTYLDEARAEATKANHRLVKLEFKNHIYLAVDRKERIWYAYRTQKEIEELLEVRKDLKLKIVYLYNPK